MNLNLSYEEFTGSFSLFIVFVVIIFTLISFLFPVSLRTWRKYFKGSNKPAGNTLLCILKSDPVLSFVWIIGLVLSFFVIRFILINCYVSQFVAEIILAVPISLYLRIGLMTPYFDIKIQAKREKIRSASNHAESKNSP
ncbi:MAG: hypothetical protein ABH837_02535 [bacterium]